MQKSQRVFGLVLVLCALSFSFGEGEAFAQSTDGGDGAAAETTPAPPSSCGRALWVSGLVMWPLGIAVVFGAVPIVGLVSLAGGAVMIATGAAMFFAGLPMFISGLVLRRRCRRAQAASTTDLAMGNVPASEVFRTRSFRFGLAAPVMPPVESGSLAVAW